MILGPEDLPPHVIGAAMVLADMIETSGILQGRIDELPPIEQRGRAIAYVATAMYHPLCEVTVMEAEHG